VINEGIIFARRPRRAPRIDLVPLVDGVFNLLIFFAVTMSLGGAQSGLSLRLPEAVTAQTLKGHVIVGLTEAGTIYVDTKTVSLDQVAAAVTRQSGGNRETEIIVRPDKRVPYERVVSAMDEIRLAGYHNLALAAVKKPLPGKRGP
jgi:biopolymer transport protein ExbD